MLSTYFKHPFTLRKLRSGPAGPYLDDFASQLAQAGYCRDKIRAYLRATGRLSAWAAQTELMIDNLDSQALVPFVDGCRNLRIVGESRGLSPTRLVNNQSQLFEQLR